MDRQMQFGNKTYTPSEVWENWVGNQGVVEFLSYGKDGQSVREIVADYVEDLDPMNLDIAAEDLGLSRDRLLDLVADGVMDYISSVQNGPTPPAPERGAAQ